MTVVDVTKDPHTLTMSIVATFDAPVARVWQTVADPRQLEQWWGPPTYPATFTVLELEPGGRAAYHMTGPDGGRSPGWWRVLAVDAPRRLEVEDGFADESGNPRDDMPAMRIEILLDDLPGGGTRLEVRTRFPSAAAMDQLVSMGMEEGMRLAMGQIDGILAG